MNKYLQTEGKGRPEAYETKSLFHLTVTIIGMFLLVGIAACKKQEIGGITQDNITLQDTLWKTFPLDTIPDGLETNRTAAYPSSSYTSVPDINVYQSTPGSSVSYGGITYYGGPFQSSVSGINKTVITFKMKRTDGVSFPAGSVLKIKTGGAGQNANAGSGTVATVTLTGSASTVTININESVTWNISGSSSSNSSNFKNYVATWYNPASRLNFYTQAIRIVAVPTGWGVQLSSYSGVPIFSNGWGGFKSTDYLLDSYGQKYQCVHYIKRFYKVAKNRNIGPGDAVVYWSNYNSVGLTQRVSNGAGVPQSGDIICFKSSSGSYHVGIVGGVVSGKLRVFQENVGQTLVSGNYCSGYKDFSFTISSGKYTVSASMLGSSWTTLGWVR